MIDTVDSDRKVLKKGLFKDEQHVRFSLVGRLCYNFGWDFWNSTEFCAEYKVKNQHRHYSKTLKKD